jgi:dephospho-CoA kinase
MNRPPVIGLLGGVGCGKSFVAQRMQARGAVVLDADRAGHAVLRDSAVIAAARARWGDGIFDADGQINRRDLAQIVFAPTPQGTAELAFLEALTHPRISQRLEAEINQLASGDPPPAIILDAPVLLKAGWNKFCDKLVFVDAPLEVRQQRVQSRGWSTDELARREAAQEPLEVKRSLCDVVVQNGGAAEQTEAEIERIWPNVAALRSAP